MIMPGLEVEDIIEKYPQKPEYLIFMLQDIQKQFGYISPKNMDRISDYAGVPMTQTYSVATFYQSFRLEPQGEHEIRVCLGTACHLKGGQRIVEDLERRLDVEAGSTTADMKYTLNTVNCLGACALAPVVVMDGEYHPLMTAQKLEKHLKKADRETADISEEMGYA